ncbi:hypothetical protein [Halomonas mongoliensis]|uniref:hypothetical protein n=1 Tax=Halomonas mongoliensis TaxID=321265 RepID=UPI00403AF383
MVMPILFKLVATAGIVILVALAVGRLGPRLGGILAGMPVILGPGYFFMLQEQPPPFVQDAVLATLHALVATLLFTVCFVLVAGRLSALRSLGLSILCWVPAALLFSGIPGGLGVAVLAYLVALGVAERVNRALHLDQPVVLARAGWLDLVLRGLLAGLLVSLATTLGAQAGPLLSGILLGFPAGILTIAWTLHERYGAEVARMTVSMTQRGMLSLIAFCSVSYLTVGRLPWGAVFLLSLVASVAVSMLLFAISRWRARRLYPSPPPGPQRP